MKKILYSLLAVAGLFTSCDMDIEPKNALLDKDAMTNVTQASYFRNGFYGSLRTIGAGYIQIPEIQADMFIGTIINGNTHGAVNNGEIFSNNDDLGSYFSGFYGQSASINYFLPRAAALLEAGLSEEDEDEVKRYVAEALFTRAYCYYYLMDHYCQAYTPENGDTPYLGMPIQSTYDPTPIISAYPGRSTLNETFAFIENDLDSCYRTLKYYEEKYAGSDDVAIMTSRNATYIGTWTVKAFQARLALLKQDWQRAYDLSKEIIDSKKFTLTSALSYKTLWQTDESTEVIFLPYCDTNEAGALPSTGSTWIASQTDKAQFIPTQSALAMYDSIDVRFDAFFAKRELNVYGLEITAPVFVKFPGNSNFNLTNSNALKNRPKMFRSSEQYLINMEAACHLGGREDEVNTMLNMMRKTRTNFLYQNKYENTEYHGSELLSQVQLERTRELIGEGFRISDLRRWGEGFVRNIRYTESDFADAPTVTVVAGREVEYEENDYRYVWPIPIEEMQSNPQLAGHQNPGY